MEHAELRSIIDLLPRYAHTRRTGWTPETLMPGRINLPDYLLLRRVAIERADEPIPLAELRANARNPYSTIDPFLDQLPILVILGLLDQSDDQYVLTSDGHELLTRGERAANDYAAGRIRLAPDDLERLSSTLEDIAERQRRAPEPIVKIHQDRVLLLRRFDSRTSPPIRLEYAIYALQRTRDDAHIAAWRAAGLRGPTLELLSWIWTSETVTMSDLVEQYRGRMYPLDISEALQELEHKSTLTINGTTITITSTGRDIREEIERETDRMCFAPWPSIDIDWVRDRLKAVTTQLIRSNIIAETNHPSS